MKRILFGNETKLEIFANTCPDCETQRGHFHEFGCVLDSCPNCGGRLLKCPCKALNIVDEMKTTEAVADGITDKQEIHRAIAQGSKYLNQTYYEEGVMLWIMKDVTARDPEEAKKADELIKDMGFRKVGNGYAITAEDVANHMNISIEEAHKVLGDLQAESQFPGWSGKTGTIQ